MKKGNLIIAGFAFALALGLTSCTKDSTCACEYNDGISDTTYDTEMPAHKKGDAQDACTSIEENFQVIDAAAKCTLN